MSEFEVFKEITIGGVTKAQLLQQLSDKGIQFNKYAGALFDHPDFLPPSHIERVKLVKLSLSNLGLRDTCSNEEFEAQVFALKLKLCPIYLAAFLRLQYLDQIEGPYLTIASKKLKMNEDYPNGFYIRNYDKALWLRGYVADGFADWPAPNEFIFMK